MRPKGAIKVLLAVCAYLFPVAVILVLAFQAIHAGKDLGTGLLTLLVLTCGFSLRAISKLTVKDRVMTTQCPGVEASSRGPRPARKLAPEMRIVRIPPPADIEWHPHAA